MIQGAFARRRVHLGLILAFVGAALFGTAMPCLAQQGADSSGWAGLPDVGGSALPERKKQILPGWQKTSKPDSRAKILELHGPRAFGLLAGDKVHLDLVVAVEKPYRLQRSSLPPSRWVNSWLELQTVRAKEIRAARVNHYAIAVNYQVFATPRAVTQESIPGFALRFVGVGENFGLRVPDWIFSMSPLLEPEPEVDNVAAIPVRADAPPLLLDAALPAFGVALCGVLSLLLGGYWLYASALWPFTRRTYAPFAQACRRLRVLKRRAEEQQALPEGYRVVHQAFNQTAGEVVFAERLERFFMKRPTFAQRRTEIEGFFVGSRRLFFGDGRVAMAGGADLSSLEALCRLCRAAEREAR
ncbi:MAG: hypothetical protein H0V62_13215 [Gammaproteobacteria bacterium]|nr:hypothetical protein [Gammaproteobacteria bacterium]